MSTTRSPLFFFCCFLFGILGKSAAEDTCTGVLKESGVVKVDVDWMWGRITNKCKDCKQRLPNGCVLDLDGVSIENKPFFPESNLITEEAAQKINEWINEVDESKDPNQVWRRCYSKTDDAVIPGLIYEGDIQLYHFHNLCNGWSGPSVAVAKLNNGKIVGGYAGKPWQTRCENPDVPGCSHTVMGQLAQHSPTSFLFSLANVAQYGDDPAMLERQKSFTAKFEVKAAFASETYKYTHTDGTTEWKPTHHLPVGLGPSFGGEYGNDLMFREDLDGVSCRALGGTFVCPEEYCSVEVGEHTFWENNNVCGSCIDIFCGQKYNELGLTFVDDLEVWVQAGAWRQTGDLVQKIDEL